MFWIAVIFILIPKPLLMVVGIVVAIAIVLFVYKLATDQSSRDSTMYALTLISAHKGRPEAMNEVGNFCLKGEGVQRDYGEAASWFRKAVDKGYGPAASSLALMYRKGLGVECNLALAGYWYERAEALGDMGAQHELEDMLIEARNRSQAETRQRQDEFRQQEEARQRQERARWEEQQRRAADDGDGGMTRKLALEILDLKEGVSREQIEAAYKRMMIKNHPDAGGSNYIAKQLNAAKQVLLGKK